MKFLKDVLRRSFGQSRMFEFASARRHRRWGYSQFGEDLHLSSFYDRLSHDRRVIVDTGLIVDIGAFRPIVHSNTYHFYKKGWTTINVDPTPGSKRLFDAVRPRDINVQLAISQNEGESSLFVFGEPSVWNTLDPDAAAIAEAATGVVPRKVAIQVRRLDSILREHIRNHSFEILSIDAEGLDIEILQSNNFQEFRPRVILIETLALSLHNIASHPVTVFLEDAGYELFSWINPNLMFVRRDSALMEM